MIAVLFWKVIDSYKASLRVQDYKTAISWAAQTSLRDVIGKTELSQMLAGREEISHDLERIIDERTEEWGVKSTSVEIRDVVASDWKGDQWLIDAGLAAGDRVVVNGLMRVGPGAPVKPVPWVAANQAGTESVSPASH